MLIVIAIIRVYSLIKNIECFGYSTLLFGFKFLIMQSRGTHAGTMKDIGEESIIWELD